MMLFWLFALVAVDDHDVFGLAMNEGRLMNERGL